MIDITVPIYTIEAHGFKVPIEFKYHASGIKYDDTSNEVGLGWSLISGGVISRSVNGALDGSVAGTFSRDVSTFVTCPDINSELDNDYVRIQQVAAGSSGQNTGNGLQLDGEMDTYSFSFLGHSGSFSFPFLNSEVEAATHPTGGNALFTPANGMRVISCTGQKIEILDTEGVYYKFEVKDEDQNLRFKEFYLTQIISVDKADTVDFTYEVVSQFVNYMRRPYITYTGSVLTKSAQGGPSGTEVSLEFIEDGGVYIQYMRPPRLKRIDFPGGYATFDYAVKNEVKTWDLQQVKIYNQTGSTPFRTVNLTKTAFTNGEQRLDKVTFNLGTSNSFDYQFGYNGSPWGMFALGPKGIDYWGYFNGAIVPYEKQYTPYFPELPYLIRGSTTDRLPNVSVIQQGVLNKITYPTKGYSEFTYEQHRGRYSLSQPVVACGGLRLAEIRNYLPDGTLAEKKWYKYGADESGIGVTNTMPPSPTDFRRTTTSLHTVRNGHGTQYLAKVSYKDTYLPFPRVSYFLMGSAAVYPQVTEYAGNATGAYGKTVYEYEVFADQQMYSEGYTYRLTAARQYARTNQWKSGNLSAKTVYKKKDDETYEKVYSIRNAYIDINKAEFRNVAVLPNIEFTYEWVGSGSAIPDYLTNFCGVPEAYRGYFRERPTLCPYDYYNYYTTTGLRVLASTTEESDGVSTVTYYNAHNVNGLPANVTRTSSEGDNVVTAFKYSTDFAYSPYADMKSANILTPVIEKTISKNGFIMRREATSYGYWHSRFFAPSFYSEGNLNESPVTRMEYKYDLTGSLRQISKDGAVKNVYLWGYNARYPIAQIQNATYDQIQAILGQPLIERVASAAVPASADLTAINNLRTNAALPGALVTTYSYQPLIGMISQTDPNGNTSSYGLDSFGRLVSIKNSDGVFVQTYEYIYKK
ncbi:hypothetical protein KK062_20910 [Fulvivirgaceae bacterium PWU5]|uniref:YD repeat-containing protein n=1 Tax=Dawidia cretensis TaxID=2782350 RepID=A0AAP2GRW5_9BACT|nr:RHS repeat domain-containing protein [Dawidia cretensis]MBT1710714.1 hypothetical protein [Dawidia cretensis]